MVIIPMLSLFPSVLPCRYELRQATAGVLLCDVHVHAMRYVPVNVYWYNREDRSTMGEDAVTASTRPERYRDV